MYRNADASQICNSERSKNETKSNGNREMASVKKIMKYSLQKTINKIPTKAYEKW